MPSDTVLLRTSIPALAVTSDGHFVRLKPGARRPPKPAEDIALQGFTLAAERNLRFLANSKEGGGAQWLYDALGVSTDVVKFGGAVAALASGIGAVVGAVGAVKKIGEFLGIFDKEPTLSDISEQITAINARLELVLAEIAKGQALDYAAWAAAHWRDVGGLVGKLQTSIDFAQFALSEAENPTDLGRQRLATADAQSQEALQTLIGGGLDGGYWMRPAFPAAVNLAAWGGKTDARPPVVDDGRVWDWRIALPTLLLALAARQIVLKALEVQNRRKGLLRAEARAWTRFVGALGSRVNEGLVYKKEATPDEMARTSHLSTHAWIGAVDTWTGLSHFVQMNPLHWWTEIAAFDRRKRGIQPFNDAPTDATGDSFHPPGRYINVGDLADTIREGELVKFANRELLFEKQAQFAYNRVAAASPLVMLCQLNSELLALTEKTIEIAGNFEKVNDRIRSYVQIGRDALAGGAEGRSTLRQATLLLDVARPLPERQEGEDISLRDVNLVTVTELLRDQKRSEEMRGALAKALVEKLRTRPVP